MSAAALLAALQARGVRLTAVGDRLRVDAPAGVLTVADRAALAAYKAALLARLRRRCHACRGTRWYVPRADLPAYQVCATCHPPPAAAPGRPPLSARGAQVLAAARARRWPRLPLWPHLAVAAGEAAWRTFCATAGAARLRQAAERLGVAAGASCPRCDAEALAQLGALADGVVGDVPAAS